MPGSGVFEPPSQSWLTKAKSDTMPQAKPTDLKLYNLGGGRAQSRQKAKVEAVLSGAPDDTLCNLAANQVVILSRRFRILSGCGDLSPQVCGWSGRQPSRR